MSDSSGFFEKGLKNLLLEIKNGTEPKLFSAMEYLLFNAGKRVRPTLMFLVADMLLVPFEKVFPFAAAIECIHTYSLIHDDLPAMDNSDMRRGAPSVHKAFGEATAILAGDALLNLAYETLLSASIEGGAAAKAASYIAKAAGSRGMAGGQSEELVLRETAGLSPEELKQKLLSMYSKKTGALIRASVMVPHILSGSNQNETIMTQIAEDIGLIFQLADDLIDAKEGGEDELSLVTAFGKKEAQQLIMELDNRVSANLDSLGEAALPLKEYAAALSRRVK